MARDDEDNYKEGVDFKWVPMKDSKGKIVKDGKGGAVKTRHFFTKAEKEAMKKSTTKATTSTSSKTPSKKRPPAKESSVSGASRSTKGKVKGKGPEVSTDAPIRQYNKKTPSDSGMSKSLPDASIDRRIPRRNTQTDVTVATYKQKGDIDRGRIAQAKKGPINPYDPTPGLAEAKARMGVDTKGNMTSTPKAAPAKPKPVQSGSKPFPNYSEWRRNNKGNVSDYQAAKKAYEAKAGMFKGGMVKKKGKK